MKDCPKELGKTARKVGLNLKEGTVKKGGQSSQKMVATQQATLRNTLSIKTSRKSPFLNSDPLTHWGGPENIAQVKINDEGRWALLHSGSTINAVNLEFVKAHSLDVGPLSNLVDGTLKINGFGDCFPDPWAMSS